MKKLTKTKVWGEILSIITDTVEANTEAFKKGKDEAFLEALTDALGASFKPAGGGKTSTKVLSDGRVYCNYFEEYLEPSEFKMKSSKNLTKMETVSKLTRQTQSGPRKSSKSLQPSKVQLRA